ncbi:hypothetical protein U1Q18_021387, partial [Sarracenia purpurea var. burkii]
MEWRRHAAYKRSGLLLCGDGGGVESTVVGKQKTWLGLQVKRLCKRGFARAREGFGVGGFCKRQRRFEGFVGLRVFAQMRIRDGRKLGRAG